MSSKSTRFVPSVRLAKYDVINKKGEDMGQVQTFVIDMHEGLVAFALVAFGGFLGITDKWFALPWIALEWHPETMKFVLDMPEEVLKNAPGMHKDKWLEEIDKWQEGEDLKSLDRYYTYFGYDSYLGIVQKMIEKRGRRKVAAKFEINKDVAGEFHRGDIVDILDTAGEYLGAGITNYNSGDIDIIKGMQSQQIAGMLGCDYGAEIIHRNNLVIL